jgi:hypothetical protein
MGLSFSRLQERITKLLTFQKHLVYHSISFMEWFENYEITEAEICEAEQIWNMWKLMIIFPPPVFKTKKNALVIYTKLKTLKYRIYNNCVLFSRHTANTKPPIQLDTCPVEQSWADGLGHKSHHPRKWLCNLLCPVDEVFEGNTQSPPEQCALPQTHTLHMKSEHLIITPFRYYYWTLIIL